MIYQLKKLPILKNISQLANSKSLAVCIFLLTFVAMNLNIRAQSSATAGQPSGSKKGASLGTYNISDLENINLYNGGLSFNVPLFSMGSRGEAGSTITLPIGSYWDYQYERQPNAPLDRIARFDLLEMRTKTSPYYSPGKMVRRDLRWAPDSCVSPSQTEETLTNFSFTNGDGSQMDFRDVSSHEGRRIVQPCGPTPVRNRGRVFVATNGSGATFYSDSDVIDYEPVVAGTLIMSNGIRYRIEAISGIGEGVVKSITDRNGNKMTFTYETNVFPDRIATITDQSNKQIAIQYEQTDPEGACDHLTYKGFGGADRTIRVCSSKLEDVLRPASGYDIKTLGELFGSAIFQDALVDPNSTVNGNVISAIYLPDNRSYKFYYNSFSELARVETPTGSAIEYDWKARDGQEYGGAYNDGLYRRLTERRVYADGTNLENKTLYPIPYYDNLDINGTFGPVEVRQQDASGNTLSSTKHYFQGSPYRFDHPYGMTGGAHDYPVWSDGLEIKTEFFSAHNVLLKSIEKEWEQPSVSWWIHNPLYAPPNGSRVKNVITTLADVSPNLVSKTTKTYDSTPRINNVTDTYEYDFGNEAPGAFLRRSHTEYVTDSNYASENVRLRSLPLETWISSDEAGNNKVSLSRFEYDNYANDSNHASLVDRANVTGHDSINFGTAHQYRGNLTAVTSYGNAPGQTEAITAYSQYDILGNVVKNIDAKGNISTISYNDNFGSPDGEAQTNTAPTQLGGNSTFAFATSATNPNGWTTYTQFDYFTTAAVDIENINGVVSSTFYNDDLDRPTQNITANNLSAFKRQTTITYDDTNRRVTTTSDLETFNDNALKSESFYDRLGRTTESRTYETATDYVSIITEYDVLGRVKRTTNPYRPLQSEPQLWTTPIYDSLGRVITMTTPDNAQVQTSYSGNTITVTDQAGKKRRSITNALGQLIRVDEPDDSGSLGSVSSPSQATNYLYDTAGNMVKVTQGVQSRYFKYDSLGRLLRVRQPEQGTNSSLDLSDSVTGNNEWSAGFTYDANNNVLTAIDIKGTVITSTYDNLNRSLSRSYSDGTPTVTNTYDASGVAYSKGKLTKTSNSVSSSEVLAFDNLGRVLTSRQTTDSVNYDSSYTYNLSGALVEETYPSGRKVKNSFAVDGKLSKIETQPSGGSYATRGDNFAYTAHGVIKHLQIGSGKWENANFNSRLQVTQLGLGNSSTDTSLWRLEYDFGTTDNNGNIKSQTTTVPTIDPLVQTFTYDSLNRLKTAVETANSSQTWKQTFTYDRYGNRNFDAGNTTTLGSCATAICNPTVDVNTNRFTTGQGYTYDLAGNIIQDPDGRQFTFNGDNKQTEVKDASNNVIGTYYYDGDGKRIKKVSANETTLFVYSGGKLVAEYQFTESTPIAPTTQYLATDMLGSPRVITDGSGNIVSRRDFMPFGEEITGLGGRSSGVGYDSDTIRQKFTGYEKDDETGLDFAEARYYNSKNGRFTAVDPLLASGKSANPQTFNRYSYTMNNPLIMTDPTGMQAATNPDEEDDLEGVDPPSHSTAFDSFMAYLRYLGRVADDFRSPNLTGLNSYINPSTGPSIHSFGEGMKKVDEGIQWFPGLGSIYNAQKAGYQAETGSGSTGNFVFEMAMMGIDFATLASGGKAKNQIVKEGVELAGETVYRTMSEKHAARFLKTGIMPAGSETMISKSQAFASGYKGVLFEFQLKSGTLKQFEQIGVRNVVDNGIHPFSNLPIVSSGWKPNNAFFKFETNKRGLSEVNIGLGNGRALDIFNSNLTNFRKISP